MVQKDIPHKKKLSSIGNIMAETGKPRERKALAQKSVKSNELRIQNTIKHSGANDLEDLMLNPDKYFPLLLASLKRLWDAADDGDKLTTLNNYISAVSSYMTNNPRDTADFKDAHAKWRKHMVDLKKQIEADVAKNKLSAKRLKNMVNWKEVAAKYNSLRKDPESFTDIHKHFQLMLLGTFLYVRPKRGDLGVVYLLGKRPERNVNCIVINKGCGTLYMNEYKTSGCYGTVEEPLSQAYIKLMRQSLKAFPRKYLFVDSNGEPYTNNNSYSQFVRRNNEEMFGKPMGVSLWRRVYINQRLDFNKMTNVEMGQEARWMCHSIAEQQKVYKSVNCT